jgi:uncharacterized membrane protein
MRARLLVFSFLIATAPLLAAHAASEPPGIKGLWLATDFPALQLRAGDDTSLSLTLYNYGLPPQRTALSITDLPADWKAEIDGEGKTVSAAFVDYDGKANLTLKLTIPAAAKPGPYRLLLKAAGEGGSSDLPIAIELAPPLAAKLTATPKLPVLKGTPRSSFDFAVTVKNESPSNMLVNLNAATPSGFQTTFKENFGSQELTSLPFKAGESKDLSVSIKPAPGTAAGRYPVTVDFAGDKAKVDTELTLDISGEAQLSLAGEDDRVSGQAYAGKEKSFPLVLRNTGTAAARDITLSASEPSGWKVTFAPRDVPEIKAGEEQKVAALVTPNAKALDGDYVVSMTASGSGASQSTSYRVTVITSTLWGVTGVGVIGAALLVLVGAVGKFGRR